ncbi:hypothetical protein [Phocaeicola sp.]
MIQKSKYGMPPPESRTELEHNVYMVLEEFYRKQNDSNALENFLWAIADELQKLEFTPNGRLNVSTITEQLRLHGNMHKWLEEDINSLKL